MTFRTACLLASLTWGALFITLLFIPGLIYWLFQIDPDPSAAFLGRRASMLFLGLAAIAFFSRNISDVATQRAISIGTIAGMGGLALLGGYEFFRGFAGIGIWVAIVVEIGFAAIFARFLNRS